jgi:hypothetical protein
VAAAQGGKAAWGEEVVEEGQEEQEEGKGDEGEEEGQQQEAAAAAQQVDAVARAHLEAREPGDRLDHRVVDALLRVRPLPPGPGTTVLLQTRHRNPIYCGKC